MGPSPTAHTTNYLHITTWSLVQKYKRSMSAIQRMTTRLSSGEHLPHAYDSPRLSLRNLRKLSLGESDGSGRRRFFAPVTFPASNPFSCQ